MSLDPEAELFSLQPQKISIRIESGGEKINFAEADLKFDPKFIIVDDIIMTNSFCDQSLILEKIIDNKNGKIVIACGATEGLAEGPIVLADLLLQPIKTGVTYINFDENNSGVFAHDGLGTEVLRAVTNGSYRIIDLRKENEFQGGLSIFSHTHTNETRWYAGKRVDFDWVQGNGYDQYAYVFDQKPGTIPDGRERTSSTSIDFLAKNDGVYYFHIVPIGKNERNPVTHYKIMVDSTPPMEPSIKASAEKAAPGEAIRFEFEDNGDNLSGMQKNFYVQFDGGMWMPTASQMSIPFMEEGEREVKLRVFDKADNFSDTGIKIKIKE
jgi:hypothetical protein